MYRPKTPFKSWMDTALTSGATPVQPVEKDLANLLLVRSAGGHVTECGLCSAHIEAGNCLKCALLFAELECLGLWPGGANCEKNAVCMTFVQTYTLHAVVKLQLQRSSTLTGHAMSVMHALHMTVVRFQSATFMLSAVSASKVWGLQRALHACMCACMLNMCRRMN